LDLESYLKVLEEPFWSCYNSKSIIALFITQQSYFLKLIFIMLSKKNTSVHYLIKI